jgi:alpha-beta hydrolase superfamily lysophospholipase
MKHSEDSFEGMGGTSIYCQCWQPDDPARALVILVHGAGEHSGRYQHVAERFTERGYVVAALDHPNHGRSGGRYGHVDRFDDFIETLGIFHRRVRADFPGLPTILLGHSMGGLISSLYLLQHQSEFIGCVLSGPAIKTDIEPGLLQMLLIRFLSSVAPKTGVLQLDANGVSRDPVEVEKYVSDPLVNHDKMSARKVSELFHAMNRIQQQAGTITLPMLIMHGEADSMASAKGSHFLHEHISSADKTLKIYTDLYHEIFNEPERAQVLADALDWCDRLLEAA